MSSRSKGDGGWRRSTERLAAQLSPPSPPQPLRNPPIARRLNSPAHAGIRSAAQTISFTRIPRLQLKHLREVLSSSLRVPQGQPHRAAIQVRIGIRAIEPDRLIEISDGGAMRPHSKRGHAPIVVAFFVVRASAITSVYSFTAFGKSERR